MVIVLILVVIGSFLVVGGSLGMLIGDYLKQRRIQRRIKKYYWHGLGNHERYSRLPKHGWYPW